ncbi:MAG: 4Fe-4S dicluster domain-containing protein [Bacillota bacterium]
MKRWSVARSDPAVASSPAAPAAAVFPARFVLPQAQGPAPSGELLVKKGDRVVAGQMLFGLHPLPTGSIVVPLHSPVSGKVVDVQPIVGPSGDVAAAVTIETDGLGERAEPLTRIWDPHDPAAWPADELRRFIRQAGVTGAPQDGGPGLNARLEGGLRGGVLVINAVGCEPGLPSGTLEAAAEPLRLLLGAAALKRAAEASEALVVVERGSVADADITQTLSHPELSDSVLDSLRIVHLRNLDWMWAPVLLAREALAQARLAKNPAVLVEPAGTAVAVGAALLDGEPLTERLITVRSISGKIKAVRASLGTPIASLLDAVTDRQGTDGLPNGWTTLLVLAGGPLLGDALADLQTPVTKSLPAVSVIRPAVRFRPESPCIRCGRCVEVCPAALMPLYIARAAAAGQMAEARALGAADCVECGACAYVCPSYRPLLQWIRLARYGRRKPAGGREDAKGADA